MPLAALTAWQSLVDTAQVQPDSGSWCTPRPAGSGTSRSSSPSTSAPHVIGTASTARHAWLTELGADELIDYTAAPSRTCSPTSTS